MYMRACAKWGKVISSVHQFVKKKKKATIAQEMLTYCWERGFSGIAVDYINLLHRGNQGESVILSAYFSW